MEITTLRLQTAHLDAQRAFYTEVLGLPLIAQAPDAFTSRAGATHLTFASASGNVAPYHFAFNIPRNKLNGAKQFLAAHVPLLTEDGRDQFHSDDWNADMVYFRDPAGNIAECIARHTLANDAPGAFEPADILCVSEIGVPVNDVTDSIAALGTRLGLRPYGERSAQFAPMGDERGLLIMVQIGRHWYPNQTAAGIAPIALTMRGPRADTYEVPDLPYRLTMVTTDEERA